MERPLEIFYRLLFDSSFIAITASIAVVDVDKVMARMVLGQSNNVAICTYLETGGMTKWIDQSALDAAINRHGYSAFSPLHRRIVRDAIRYRRVCSVGAR